MYSPRRRKYISKKYYRNRLFAPALAKANIPNFYQMKGRIIQQSPSNIKEPVTENMTQKKLTQMYETLIKFKYPPVMSNLPFDPTPYTFVTDSEPIILSEIADNVVFDNNYFQNMLDNFEKPNAPEGYSYYFDVIQCFIEAGVIENDTSRFYLAWNSTFVGGTSSLFSKLTDSTYTTLNSGTSLVLPRTSANITKYHVDLRASEFAYLVTSVATSPYLINNSTPIALVTSNVTEETYASNLQFVRSVTSDNQDHFSISFRLLIYLQAD